MTLAAFNLVALQENNSAISFKKPWTRTALSGAFGGSVSFASDALNNAVLKSTGTGFAIVATKGPDRGNAEVWVDRTRVATISLYAPTVTQAQVVFVREGLANATHEVELRVLGTRTAPSTGNRVDLDAFIAVR